MARVFAGELSMIDQEVFDAIKRLPDTFWALAEFNIGRNVDWFIVRPGDPSTLILTELKRVSKPLRGGVNGLWEKLSPTGDWEELPANGTDTNPYWQAVNSANALADWLWNNQQLYRTTSDIRPSGDFRVWPDLMLLSPPGTQHRLPLGPPSRYGRWWFSLEDWLRHVDGWTPRTGVRLTAREVEDLTESLRLTEIWSGGEVEGGLRPTLEAAETLPPPSFDVFSFATYLQSLEERLARLERQVTVLTTPPVLPGPVEDGDLGLSS